MRARLRRSHVKLGLFLVHLQLAELLGEFAENVRHGTRLLEHAVAEGADHVADGQSVDTRLEQSQRVVRVKSKMSDLPRF